MFPYLEREVPREPESFSRLLADVADEKFYKNVLSWGVRYLIFVSGFTGRLKESSWGCAMCFPLVFGYEIGIKKTQLTASILDLHQKETIIDDLENISEGTSGWGFLWLFQFGTQRLQNQTPVGIWVIVWARFC